jgi:hypothetical protein
VVATVNAFLPVTVVFFDRFENPTIDSGNESILAITAIFMVGSDFEEGHVLRQ